MSAIPVIISADSFPVGEVKSLNTPEPSNSSTIKNELPAEENHPKIEEIDNGKLMHKLLSSLVQLSTAQVMQQQASSVTRKPAQQVIQEPLKHVGNLVKPIDTPTYDESSGDDVRVFASRFLSLCQTLGCSDSVAKARLVNTAIKDSVKMQRWYRMKDREHQTIKEVLDEMVAHVAGEYSLFDDKRSMIARKQNVGETVGDYEIAKRELMSRTALPEEEQIFYFVEGLHDKVQASLFALLAVTHGNATAGDFKGMKLDEVVRKARIVEARPALHLGTQEPTQNGYAAARSVPRSIPVIQRPIKQQVNEVETEEAPSQLATSDDISGLVTNLVAEIIAKNFRGIPNAQPDTKSSPKPRGLPDTKHRRPARYACFVCKAAGVEAVHYPDECPFVIDAMKAAAAVKQAQPSKPSSSQSPSNHRQVNGMSDAPR